MRIIGGQVFDLEKGFVERDLCTDGKLISENSGDDVVIDAADCYVIPGLVDVHFHGAVGEDFSDASAEGLQKIADFELSEGVTYICPTQIFFRHQIRSDGRGGILRNQRANYFIKKFVSGLFVCQVEITLPDSALIGSHSQDLFIINIQSQLLTEFLSNFCSTASILAANGYDQLFTHTDAPFFLSLPHFIYCKIIPIVYYITLLKTF